MDQLRRKQLLASWLFSSSLTLVATSVLSRWTAAPIQFQFCMHRLNGRMHVLRIVFLACENLAGAEACKGRVGTSIRISLISLPPTLRDVHALAFLFQL
ncbi:hypothetical protein C8Q78DRAFT_1008490 [Trametes maxima]|nr:hypothetical protein C8Q78DRAFT_1008490 [Trametes maxima]